jgi:hypothetical protein
VAAKTVAPGTPKSLYVGATFPLPIEAEMLGASGAVDFPLARFGAFRRVFAIAPHFHERKVDLLLPAPFICHQASTLAARLPHREPSAARSSGF